MEKTEVANIIENIVNKKKPGRPRKNTNIDIIAVAGVMQAPIFDTNVIEMIYCNPFILKKIISLYHSYNCDELYITFNKENMLWYSVDHLKKVHIYADINGHNISYYCTEPITMQITRINIELVFNILDKNASSVTIMLENKLRTKLIFLIKTIEYDTTERLEINVSTVDSRYYLAKPDITNYPISFKISSKHLKDRLSNISKFDTQTMSFLKCKTDDFVINVADDKVSWAGVYNSPAKINFRSTLTDDDVFTLSLNTKYLYSLSNNNLGQDFNVALSRNKMASFKTVLDERDHTSPTITVQVFIEVG
jgi:hypothetical protein